VQCNNNIPTRTTLLASMTAETICYAAVHQMFKPVAAPTLT